jgi:hypothetical protein
MNNFQRILNLLLEKPMEVSEDDFLEFGEDFDVSVPRKLYQRARGVGMQNKEIADLAKKKTLEKTVTTKEDDEKYEKQKKADANRSAKSDKEDETKLKKEFEAKFPKSKMTDAQYKKLCKDAMSDYKADNGDEMTSEDVAHDMADSMLHDKELFKYIARKIESNNRDRIISYLADDLVN